jgi:hypothetical protein
MVTQRGISKTNNDYEFDFMGLSTDTKPLIADCPEMKNGSSFFEMDTKTIYFYDAENDAWV